MINKNVLLNYVKTHLYIEPKLMPLAFLKPKTINRMCGEVA